MRLIAVKRGRGSQGVPHIDRFAADMRNRPTPAEDRVARTLNRLGIPYDQQRVFGKYIVDFYFPGLGLALEVDGGYHGTKQQMDRDALRTKVLQQFHGVSVLRVPNRHVYAADFASYLQSVVGSTRRKAPPARPKKQTLKLRKRFLRHFGPGLPPGKILRRRNGAVSALTTPEAPGGRLEGKRAQTPGHAPTGNPAPQDTGQVRASSLA